jgi:pimeloyl-ACP methyl ester carboxylesterase
MAEKNLLIGNIPLPSRQKRPTSYRRQWKKVLVALGVSVVGLYFLLLIMVFIYQDQLIFAAPRTIPDTTPASANIPFEDLHIPVEASIQVHAWWIPAQQPSTKVILYFHGNGYALESEATEEAPLFHQTGANLLLVDYRGYGTSSRAQANGPRSEADAHAAMRYLIEQRHVNPSHVWIAGWSIGSAVAAQLATQSPAAAGLILFSPITSVNDVAHEEYGPYLLRPLEWLGHENDFDTKVRISSVRIPVLIMSGTLDELAPPWMAKVLYEHANAPKTIRLIEGAHHNDFLDVGDGNLVRGMQSFIGTTPAP